jgi:MFS transporter, UMF1 family
VVTWHDPCHATTVAAPPRERLRRQRRGWYFYDWANSAFYTTVVAVFFGPYLGKVAEAAADARGYVHPLGLDVRAKAVYPLAVTVSVLAQLLVLPLAGALADHTGRRRMLLASFAYLGSAATVAMFLVTGGRYLAGAALFALANLAFGASVVVYNSFLPDLAGPDERDAISSRGWGMGFLGGGLLLGLDLALYLGRGPLGLATDTAVRISLASAGLWWAGFTLIPVLTLRDRARGAVPVPRAGRRGAGGASSALRQLGGTLRDLRQRPVTLRFLLAYLVYNDGVQTVITLSATYATAELGLGQSVVISAVLLVQFVAFAGALLLGRLAVRHGARRVVLGSLVAWILAVAASYVLQRGSAVQFLALAAVIGVVLGGTQALSRSLFSHLVPRAREAEYFAFYEVSDRGTSWIGPLVFAATLQWTDSYRDAIASLVVLFAAGFVLLLFTDLRRGVREAGNPLPGRL